MKYPTYPAYKDSGVDWLGEVPAHWEVRRLGTLGRFDKGGGFSKSDLVPNGVDAIIYGDIYSRYDVTVSLPPRKVSPELAAKSVPIQNGDLLFTGSGETIEDIGKSIAYLKEEMCVAGGDIIILREPRADSLFLSYMMNSPRMRVQKSKTGKGEIIVHTYASKLKNLYFPLPPLHEQKAIATFLDEKTAQIDRAVAQNERLMDLLRERQQIVVQNAVTRGLDPDVEMKDSGEDWIGEVPKHWEVVRNATIFQERKDPGENGLPILTVSIHSAVSKEELKEAENIRGKIRIEDKSNYKRVYPKDIVYNMMRAWQGAIGNVPTDGLVSPAYVTAFPKKKLNSSFLEHLFRTSLFIEEMNRFSKGIADFRKRLYWQEFKNLNAVLPPLSEQSAIVAHIEAQATKTEKAISLLEQQNKRLKEYKAVLIDRAVTGKINITDHVSPISE